ncbi:acyl-CoA dehydrogenase family protein [Chloroflexota bacterium]
MDFGLNEQQQMLKKAANDFLEKECPKTVVRELEEDEKGYSPELWRKMAELGWLGLVFPEDYDGMGGDFQDLVIILEEMGKALLPAPFLPTVVCGGLPILDIGSEEQKREFLPRIANGELILAFALTEPSASILPSGVTLKAVAQGDEYVLSGTKLFVTYAHIADYLLCAARTIDGNDEDGITLFLVDCKSKGLSYTLLKTIGSDKQCEVDFQNVKVTRKNILGEADKGWPVIKNILDQAAIAESALMLGGGEQVLEMTIAHATERIQFGQPIGSFQSIQHKCADMSIDVEGARYTTYLAASRLSKGLPYSLEASMAKAWTSDAYQRICCHGQQIHGGVGLITDHDVQLYFRRSRVSEQAFGDAVFHREEVAQKMGL